METNTKWSSFKYFVYVCVCCTYTYAYTKQVNDFVCDNRRDLKSHSMYGRNEESSFHFPNTNFSNKKRCQLHFHQGLELLKIRSTDISVPDMGALLCFMPFCSTASGPLRCGINNGGCWKKTQNGKTYSACRVSPGTPCGCFVVRVSCLLNPFFWS